MVSIFILCILLFGFFMGLKRGFILQLLHLLGFIVAFIAAVLYYKKLAAHLVSWIPYPELGGDQTWAIFLNSMPLENAFYNAIAFASIFFGVKIILQIVASMLDFVTRLPLLRHLNKLLGAVLGFVEVYLLTFIILYIFALVPLTKIQTYLEDSVIAMLMIEHTPFLSKAMESLWFTELLGKVIS